MKRLAKVSVIAFALLIMLTPLLACGGAVTPPPPPPPSGNQPPVISSLTAESPTLVPGVETKITCDASDPDGDTLTYTWTTTAGTITETYKTFIFWQAPGFVGESTVSVTVSDGKGHTASQSLQLNVVTNQLPVVNSVTASPATLKPGETSTVTCTASDPDGDTLTYTWSASGGAISGTGKIVTWQAPSATGEFLIKVKVDDSKGGTAEGSCRIVVEIPATTAILTPLPDESGSIYYDGTLIPEFRIGDNASNVGVRPYFSYNITELEGAEIKEAKLTFTIKGVVGQEPWFVPPGLYVECVDYGARSLISADYHTVKTAGELQSYKSTLPTEIDVRALLISYLKGLKPRFQVRMYLAGDGHNYNSQADYIEFSKAELTVTYIK
jgi:hypothetical protein